MNQEPREKHGMATVLEKLIEEWESEVVEFKQAGKDYSTDKLGEYFSALANEANLRGAERAWLIFGVDNKTRKVVGTDYRPEPERLQRTKMQMVENAEPSITFRNIFELPLAEGRVILFEIPAAPRGLPIAWKGHYYARAGESLVTLALINKMRFASKHCPATGLLKSFCRQPWITLTLQLWRKQGNRSPKNMPTAFW